MYCSQRSSSQLTGNNANKLVSSSYSFEPAERLPVSGAGSVPLLSTASVVTGEQADKCSRHLVPPRDG